MLCTSHQNLTEFIYLVFYSFTHLGFKGKLQFLNFQLPLCCNDKQQKKKTLRGTERLHQHTFHCLCQTFFKISCPWSNRVSRWHCCQKDLSKQMTQIYFYICASVYKSLVSLLKCFSGQSHFKIPLQQLLAIPALFFPFSVYQILFQSGIYSSQCNTKTLLRIHFSFPG